MTPVYRRRRPQTLSLGLLSVAFAGTACLDYAATQPVSVEPPRNPPSSPEPTAPEPTPVTPAPDDTSPEPPAPVVVPEVLPGAHLFGDDQVLEVHLTLTASDHTSLEENGNEEIYLPAQARITGAGIGEVLFAQIGMRHKGAYSLHHCWDEAGVRSYEGSCSKLSYKLKFDEYTDSRLDGVKRLNLHASSNDASRLRELMAYSTFRDFGVEAPRTALARVYVNGVLEGLFIAVEALDGRFTKAHFPEGGGDGNLYKEIWPRAALDSTKVAASLRTNEDVGDVSAFLAFGDAVDSSTHATFESSMAEWIDIEHTLRYIAVDRALKNWDGIMAFYSPTSPHNFYWYHDSGGTGRFQLVPWDMDNSLWAFDPYMSPSGWVTAAPVPDWNEEPLACNQRSVWDMSGEQTITPPRCDRFLDLLAETHFDRFASIALELLAGPLEPARLLDKVRHFSALLEPIIAEDPDLDVAAWRAQRANFELVLERANSDFRTFASGGLRTEAL